MERELFNTLLNKDHKFFNNEHVKGRILGIAEIICELNGGFKEKTDHNGNKKLIRVFRGFYWSSKDGNTVYLQTRCTKEQYEKFKTYVEDIYPGLCTFYYDVK